LLHDGAAITGQTNATLRLVNVQLSDAGAYAVSVSNEARTVLSSNAQLRVIVPSTILRLIAQPLTNSVVITSIPGLNYTLEAADNLSDLHWVSVQTRPGVGNELTLQDTAPALRSRFYRIRVE